ncbi:hypothetical protein OG874_33835 [Nocardia sp. NBC_00565]|uniref:hypothetical protein n=1 Tax=Nocardia sp. NBC_00565 TaxID=2975993 RepID=UPI002E7FF6C9|nr:hypothetical protein [Nocardia sp. NBC_00565]WUC01716.1 hypothetical protein OG874_33835 [Nocardia sp. NBC_00565]
MALTVWQDQGIDQFREIAGRLASVIQSGIDRSGALNQFAESISSGEAFTDLMIEYSSRWFTETGGRSILIGPELFWLMSEPSPRRVSGTGMRVQESYLDTELTAGQRARILLLICVYEALAQNQWAPEGIAEHMIVTNGVG